MGALLDDLFWTTLFTLRCPNTYTGLFPSIKLHEPPGKAGQLVNTPTPTPPCCGNDSLETLPDRCWERVTCNKEHGWRGNMGLNISMRENVSKEVWVAVRGLNYKVISQTEHNVEKLKISLFIVTWKKVHAYNEYGIKQICFYGMSLKWRRRWGQILSGFSPSPCNTLILCRPSRVTHNALKLCSV
jgi:hypothetical protein